MGSHMFGNACRFLSSSQRNYAFFFHQTAFAPMCNGVCVRPPGGVMLPLFCERRFAELALLFLPLLPYQLDRGLLAARSAELTYGSFVLICFLYLLMYSCAYSFYSACQQRSHQKCIFG